MPSASIFQKGYVMPRNDERKGTSNRGFASMDQAKQRAIASKGGQSVPPEKRSFSQDPSLAAQAGRKGGQARGASAQRRAASTGGGGNEAENAEFAKGTGTSAMPREPSMDKQMSPTDEDRFGVEEMESGNDLDNQDLDQHPGMPPRGSDKEHPQRAR